MRRKYREAKNIWCACAESIEKRTISGAQWESKKILVYKQKMRMRRKY
jgi:hypothetical protein